MVYWNNTYKVIKIIELNGENEIHSRMLDNICRIDNVMTVGAPCWLSFIGDQKDKYPLNVRTSPLEKFYQSDDNTLVIKTRNTIYEFQIIP